MTWSKRKRILHPAINAISDEKSQKKEARIKLWQLIKPSQLYSCIISWEAGYSPSDAVFEVQFEGPQNGKI